jgi:hypothetical protein
MVIFHSYVSLPEDICFGTCILIIVPAQGLLLLILFPIEQLINPVWEECTVFTRKLWLG